MKYPRLFFMCGVGLSLLQGIKSTYSKPRRLGWIRIWVGCHCVLRICIFSCKLMSVILTVTSRESELVFDSRPYVPAVNSFLEIFETLHTLCNARLLWQKVEFTLSDQNIAISIIKLSKDWSLFSFEISAHIIIADFLGKLMSFINKMKISNLFVTFIFLLSSLI